MLDDNKLCVGIDVSKHKLDVACSNHASVQTFDSTSDGFKQLLDFLKKHNPVLVCPEATGGYE